MSADSNTSNEHHVFEVKLPEPAKWSRRKSRLFFFGASAVFVVALLAGGLPRYFAKKNLEKEVAESAHALPRVETLMAKILTSDRDLILPGTIEALEQTVIYARAQGYVRRWNVDIGAKVKEGQVLAEIDTPEIDSQLEQVKAQAAEAAANVLRAEANSQFSETSLARYERLAPAGVASQQDLEKQQAQSQVDKANVSVAKASVIAQQANVRRLMLLKGFSKVIAPFSGTIISRTAERGQLVSAGATPLFKLASIDEVRVMLQIPQDLAPSIQTQGPAKVTVREFAGTIFDGIVAHAAGALDNTSRTMNVEVRVQNRDGKLLTGMYAQASLSIPTPHKLYEIPVTALYTDSKGTRVATVTADNTIQMKNIVIERDTGQTLQIAIGLDGTERIVKLANADLDEGSTVEVIKEETK